MKRYDDQFFARCFKQDRKRAQFAAKAMDMTPSEFIRRAVREKAERVASTEEAHPGAYRVREKVIA